MNYAIYVLEERLYMMNNVLLKESSEVKVEVQAMVDELKKAIEKLKEESTCN